MTPEQLRALQARATRPRRTVPVVCDGDLGQRIEVLLAEVEELANPTPSPDARLGSKAKTTHPRVAEVNAELDALYEQARGSTLYVVLEGLAGTPWRALVAQHPVQKDEAGNVAAADKPWGVDRAAIEEPLIRACVIGQRDAFDADEIRPLPAETLDWLLDWMTVHQREALFITAWTLCRGDDAVPLRRAR